MPIYTRDGFHAQPRPDWVEITDWTFHYIERIKQGAGRSGADGSYWGTASDDPRPTEITLLPRAKSDRVVVFSGEVVVETESGRFHASRRDYVDLPASGARLSSIGYSAAELVHISGTWDRAIRTEICAFGPGVPCDYHYHDGQEYWFTFRGHFDVQYDGADHPMRPDMLLAARRGHEHGIAELDEEMRAVVLATGLEGRQRDGHLTREHHGDPDVAPE